MQYGSSVHHAKHQSGKVITLEDYELRESRYEQLPSKLLDPPPYADFYMNSYSFEFRPETQTKVGVVDYNQRAKYKVNDVGNNQRAKYRVIEEEEDVNAEADEFIKHEHKMFQAQLRQKSMSLFN